MRVEPERTCPTAAGASDVAVRWFGPARSQDMETLDQWCATVGSAVYDTMPDTHMVGSRVSDSLVVVSWNVNVGGGDVLAFLEDRLGVTCGGVRAAEGSPHFALLLQEAHRRSAAIPPAESGPTIPDRIVPEPRPGPDLDVVQLADRCGLSFVYVPSARNGSDVISADSVTPDTLREDKGNAVLSTLPLRRLVAIELPFEAGRKVAVGATVFLTPTDSVQLVSVHLDVASTLARAVSTGNSWRLRQGLGFVEGLQLADSAGSTIATLAAGDFNTWSGDETVIRHMYDYFPESPPQGKHRTRGSFPTDYLFFRQAGTAVVLLDGPEILEERYHSDHLPLVATVGAGDLPSPGP